MANFTTILGTDSLSSSRVVINDNFSLVNAELGDITALLDTTAQTINLVGNGTFGTLTVFGGGLNRFIVNSSQVISGLETVLQNTLVLEAGLQVSSAGLVTALPGANAYEHETYVVDASILSNVTLTAGDNGQQITIIASGGSITFNTASLTGPTSAVLNDGGSMTLKYVNGTWYVVSAMNASVSY